MKRNDTLGLSIVLPAKNEAAGLSKLLPKIKAGFPEAEIIVVDDGSSDDTARIVQDCRCRLVRHPYSLGNGAAIKSGTHQAQGEIIVFMDADSQHNPEDIHRLLAELDKGYDMVIGARDTKSQASVWRLMANTLYNRLSSYIVNHRVLDLTSGFRAVRADKFREFLYLLPNGFSYPTTSTMAFFRAGYPISFIPIVAAERVGKSHIKPIKDGVRFFLIIFKIGTLYSPLKLFFPTALSFFILGLGYYLYTFSISGRFTNMGILLFITSLLIFMIGLVSEQITNLTYKRDE